MVIETSFKTKKERKTTNITQYYAPINYDSKGDKDQFYERLKSIEGN